MIFVEYRLSQVEAAPDGPKNIFLLLAAAINGAATVVFLSLFTYYMQLFVKL